MTEGLGWGVSERNVEDRKKERDRGRSGSTCNRSLIVNSEGEMEDNGELERERGGHVVDEETKALRSYSLGSLPLL